MWETILELILSLIVCGLAVERTTETISEGEIFAPFRNFISHLAYRNAPKLNKTFMWIHKLITCGYCTSHWVAILFVWTLPGNYFELNFSNNIGIKWIALVGASNIIHSAFSLLYKGRVLTVDLLHKQEIAEDTETDTEESGD